MDSIEIKRQLDMTYSELVEYLLKSMDRQNMITSVRNHANQKIQKYLEQVKDSIVIILMKTRQSC